MNKSKLINKLGLCQAQFEFVGVGVGGWVAGLTENKTKPASWGLG
jgi:hypothetical protein